MLAHPTISSSFFLFFERKRYSISFFIKKKLHVRKCTAACRAFNYNEYTSHPFSSFITPLLHDKPNFTSACLHIQEASREALSTASRPSPPFHIAKAHPTEVRWKSHSVTVFHNQPKKKLSWMISYSRLSIWLINFGWEAHASSTTFRFNKDHGKN